MSEEDHQIYTILRGIIERKERFKREAGAKAASYIDRAIPFFDKAIPPLQDALFEYIVAEKEHEGRIHIGTPAKDGNIPVLTVSGKGLAEAWENSMLALYKHGCTIRTQYDKKDNEGNFIDPPSRDSTLTFIVEDPSSEPFIHRAFPGGLEDLEEYRQEVVEGIKNHWVRDPTDTEDDRWEYTYNERLFEYAVPLNKIDVFLREMPQDHRKALDAKRIQEKKKPLAFLLEQGYTRVEKRPVKKWHKEEDGTWSVREAGTQEHLVIDQIEYVIDKLSKQPYSRQAQAITWKPQEDTICFDPACLQSLWFRILPDEEGIGRLNMNVRFRSRDAYDAAFMNAFAFIHLQERVAAGISEKAGIPIKLGRYLDISDSYHIYGRRLGHFRESFVSLVCTREFEDRTWDREFAQPIFDEAKPKIAKKIAEQDAKRAK